MKTFYKARDYMLAKQDNNFCSVVAISAVSGIEPYIADNITQVLGRKRGHGTSLAIINQAIEVTGHHLICIDGTVNLDTGIVYPYDYTGTYGKTFITCARSLSRHKGKYLILSRTHIAAVVNGVLEDWSENCRGRVVAIFKVNELKG